MKIQVFKNSEEYLTRDYELINTSAQELSNALFQHCEDVGVEPTIAAVIIQEKNGWQTNETIVKGTSTVISMNEVAVEILAIYNGRIA
jgi:hypothetical protein